MARKGTIDANVERAPEPHTRDTQYISVTSAVELEMVREEARNEAAALSEFLPERSADARREVPRTITDAINPRKARHLPSPTAVRPALSSNMKKDLNRKKVGWQGSMPRAHTDAMQKTVRNRDALAAINRELHGVVGYRSELPRAIGERVSRIDRAIQSYERQNDREHVVYTTLRAPHDHGSSRSALRERLQSMAQDPESKLTFDSYLPATHTLGQVNDSRDIVMEIRTRSGAYLGTSDTLPNADHIVGRGRVLHPVSVHEAPYVRPDGTQGTRWVVQMEDVTPTE